MASTAWHIYGTVDGGDGGPQLSFASNSEYTRMHVRGKYLGNYTNWTEFQPVIGGPSDARPVENLIVGLSYWDTDLGYPVTWDGAAWVGGGNPAWVDVTGKPAFATVATSGAYGDLTGRPALFSGAYGDLTGIPTLGTAAAQDVGAFATAAQGEMADAALQPGAQIPWTDVTGKPALFSGAYGDLSGVPATFAPAAHSHAIADTTGLQAALDGKQAAGSYATAAQGALADTASQPGHAHAQADVTGLVSALAGKQPLAAVLTGTTASFTTAQESKLAGIATGATVNATDADLRDRATHTGTQAIATVTGLQSALDGKASVAQGVPAGGTTGQLLMKSSGTDYATEWGAKITISATEPVSPAVGDIWVDIS